MSCSRVMTAFSCHCDGISTALRDMRFYNVFAFFLNMHQFCFCIAALFSETDQCEFLAPVVSVCAPFCLECIYYIWNMFIYRWSCPCCHFFIWSILRNCILPRTKKTQAKSDLKHFAPDGTSACRWWNPNKAIKTSLKSTFLPMGQF